jgi:hypothetical protein
VRRQFQVVATEDLEPGQPILCIDGVLVDRPTRYTIQIGERAHVERPEPTQLEHELDHYPWRFLNHSCAPNAILCNRTFVALHPIGKGGEVTFDYTTTEYDMSCPFPCGCGAPACLGIVRGFRHLSPEQQRARAPYLAEYLRHLLRDGCEATVRGATSAV